MSTVAPPAQAVIRRNAISDAEIQQMNLIRRLKRQRALDLRWLLQAVNSIPITISQPIVPSLLPQFSPQRHLPPSTNTRIFELPDIPPTPLPPPVAPSRATSRFARTSSSSADSSVYLPPRRESPPRGKDPLVLEREAHDQFISDVTRILQPLIGEEDAIGQDSEVYDDGSVLLCWGSAANCRVLNVRHFQDDMDHELFWKRLNQAWYQIRGEWRRKLPGYGICNVKMVDIRLVGPIRDCPDQFYGVFESVEAELEMKKEDLGQKVKKFQEIETEAQAQRQRRRMESYENDHYDEYDDWGYETDDPDDWMNCQYDARLGRTIHGDYCVIEETHGLEDCTDGEYPESRNRLNGLMMESLRTLLLQNPQMALHHKLMNAGLVHYKSFVRSQIQDRPYRGLGQIVFRGLLVEDGWTFDRGLVKLYMPLAGIVVILIVLLAWLAYGDWAIAWNVGSCMVPLLMGLAALPQ